MFAKILIANRGEIAVRIIRACRELGIQTVAVYSTADREALHVELADEAICIGGARSHESYLNMQQILSAAVVTKAEAIHPGFGFLAENSQFAAMCEECQIAFIGPKSETIEQMGNKIQARQVVQAAGVPIIPGSLHALATYEEALVVAEEIGYPLMIKAAAGGGGKGIRKVNVREEFPAQFAAAQQEARAAFSSDEVYLEKVVYPAKHIEVQILADHFGKVLHLGERDCSLQRNSQKVLEEAPAHSLPARVRTQLGEYAVQCATAVDYQNAGTIEFLVDEEENMYFMEMNTRIQVEHPVTEMITGVDIVKQQIAIAYGEALDLNQEDIVLRGHAIECRLNAENPQQNFAPAPGKITQLFLPSGCLGLRVDSAVYQGYTIPPFYDSMVAKIIVHADTRFDALLKMQRALLELSVEGVTTNAEFQLDLLSHPQVVAGDYSTAFLHETFLPTWDKLK